MRWTVSNLPTVAASASPKGPMSTAKRDISAGAASPPGLLRVTAIYERERERVNERDSDRE